MATTAALYVEYTELQDAADEVWTLRDKLPKWMPRYCQDEAEWAYHRYEEQEYGCRYEY